MRCTCHDKRRGLVLVRRGGREEVLGLLRWRRGRSQLKIGVVHHRRLLRRTSWHRSQSVLRHVRWLGNMAVAILFSHIFESGSCGSPLLYKVGNFRSEVLYFFHLAQKETKEKEKCLAFIFQKRTVSSLAYLSFKYGLLFHSC